MIRHRQRLRGETAPVLATQFIAEERDYDLSADEHNFRQDVANGITPYFFYQDRPTFTAEVVGDKTLVEPILNELGDRHTRDISEQLGNAVRKVARVISWRGRAVFEICHDDQGALHLVSIPDRGLWIFRWFCVQFIPRKDREHLKKRVNVVRTSKLWIVRMPRALGGHWGFAAVLRRLRSANHLGPAFFRRNFPISLDTSGYNFRTYAWALDVFQEIVTLRWQWNRRDTSLEHTTEMYYVYKKLGFRAAQATLRDYVVVEINRLFTMLGVAASVKLTGVPTPTELLEARERFMRGEMSIKEALKFSRLGS